MSSRFPSFRPIVAALALAACAGAAPAQITTDAFTYQGQLNTAGQPATGTFDFRYRLFDALTAGNAVGPERTMDATSVEGGLFSQHLDFGSVFRGRALWLQIEVKPAGAAQYTTLTPRHLITAAPYAAGLAFPFNGEAGSIGTMMTLTQTGSGAVLRLEAAAMDAAQRIEQNGTGEGLIVRNLGAGAAAEFENAVSGAAPTMNVISRGTGAAVNATTATNARAGSFVSTGSSASADALYAENIGPGNALQVWAKGFGRGLLVKLTNSLSTHDAARFETQSQGSAVFAKKTGLAGAGAALTAQADPYGTALNVSSGAIRCQGAGVNTNTWVFRHVLAPSDVGTARSIINNEMCNAEPGAILFLSPNQHGEVVYNQMACTYYDWSLQKWCIRPGQGGGVFTYPAGSAYSIQSWNIMVVKP